MSIAAWGPELLFLETQVNCKLATDPGFFVLDRFTVRLGN